jgi:acyl-CoA thioesterase I
MQSFAPRPIAMEPIPDPPANALPPERLAYQIQFTHPEKILARLPGMDEHAVARGFAIPVAQLRAIRAAFAQAADAAAQELLADPSFADQVARLPLAANTTVIGLGDSITDDSQSWFEILRRLLARQRPGEAIHLVNAGISGETTSQILSRFLAVANLRPAWVLCLAGTNDARLHGLAPLRTLLGPDETRHNLRALRHFAATQAGDPRWLWITPATVIEEKIRMHWHLGTAQAGFRNRDLDVVADIVRAQAEPVVDLQKVFGRPPREDWLLDDGLHPSPEGQKAIVRAVVARLCAL